MLITTSMSLGNFFRNIFGRDLGNPPGHFSQEENQPFFDSTLFENFGNIPDFEKLDQFFSQIFEEAFQSISVPTEYPPNVEASPWTEKPLRDQMLKPSWEHSNNFKQDSDLDDAYRKHGSLDKLMSAPKDNSINHLTRSSTSFFKNINGASESKSVTHDREGCRREISTKEFGDKKYVLEVKKCPGVPDEFMERLFNLKKEELPDFLKRWDYPQRQL